MAINGEWIDYDGGSGYFAYPENASETLPAILVIQEIGGVNAHIEDVTRRLAAAGYAALAPDLFAVDGSRPDYFSQDRIDETLDFIRGLPSPGWRDPVAREAGLSRLPEPQRPKIAETCNRMLGAVSNLQGFVPGLRQAVRHLRAEHPVTMHRKVACVGFCMGGGLSALLACEEPELAGAAVYYGSTPPARSLPSLRCPVIGFYGAEDQRINAGIPDFDEELRRQGREYERYIYDGANHSFFNDDIRAYNVRAVRDSYVRLLAFFFRILND